MGKADAGQLEASVIEEWANQYMASPGKKRTASGEIRGRKIEARQKSAFDGRGQ